MANTFLVRRDVGTELNIEFSETSQPSSAEVESIIEDIEAEIKGSINVSGLAVPTKALNPISYRIVHNVVLWGVVARVQAAYGGNVMNLSPREEMYWERFMEGKTKIEQYPRYLSDATDLTSTSDLDISSSFIDTHDDYREATHAMDDEY